MAHEIASGPIKFRWSQNINKSSAHVDLPPVVLVMIDHERFCYAIEIRSLKV